MGAKNTFKFSKIFFLILVFALGNFTTVFAQCGTDSSFEICTKETYNQGVGNADGVVDLFKILGGSPSVGGSWTDVSNSGGLDISSGLLDTWSVKRGGIYKYQYTNGACSATVTLTIGGYTGIKSKTYTGGTCNTINKLFLNGFLENNPTSDNNGTWTGGPVGTITGSSFDGTKIILPPGGSSSFNLTYTVSAIGNCPSRSTDVNFKVEAPSNPGTPIALEVCETDSFSSYTNLNLSSLITGYVSGGDWSDVNSVLTGEISDITDSTINLKNIYNTFGSGVYKFSYTLSSGLYCDPGIATVQITIKPVIDLTGATLALSPKELCFSAINASTQVGAQIDSSKLTTPVPDGVYIITYTQTGVNPKSATTINVTFSGGLGNFFLDATTLINTGITTINVTGIAETGAVSPAVNCSRTISNLNVDLTINPDPNFTDSKLTVADVCLGQDGVGVISDIASGAIELIDGTYDVGFVPVANGVTGSGVHVNMIVQNGTGTFKLDKAFLNSLGTYKIQIRNATDLASGCKISFILESNDFQVLPVPDATTIAVSANSICLGDPTGVNVIINNAKNLPDGSYDIVYDLKGTNGQGIDKTGLVATNVNFVGGVANPAFSLPNNILAVGNTTLTITSLNNSTSTCETTTFTNPIGNFIIYPIPDQSEIIVGAKDICIGNDLLINFNDSNIGIAPELPDGNYTITYSISGVNQLDPTTTNVNITSGVGSFNILKDNLPLVGANVLTLNFDKNNDTGCIVTGTSKTVPFNVLPIPDINNAALTVLKSPVCQGDAVNLQITGTNLINGFYDIKYNFSGASNVTNLTATNIEFVSGDSKPFSVPTFVTGNYTITLTNVTNVSSSGNCSSIVNNVSTSFTVVSIPILTLVPSVPAHVCLNSDVPVVINENISNLADGTYKVQFTLSDSNIQNTPPVEVSFLVSGGKGTFFIPFNFLPNTGNTTISIVSISSSSSSGNCFSNPVGISSSFIVDPLINVDNTGTTIAQPISTVCLGSSVPISFTAPALTSGNTYNVAYTVVSTNGNVNTSGSAQVQLDNQNGGSFTIDTSNLNVYQAGDYVLTIIGIADPSVNCPGSNNNTPITANFTLDPLPSIVSADVVVSDICLNNNATITINNLPIGNYDVEYSLTGQSGTLTASIIVPTSNTINIDKSLLPTSGDYTITISKISATNTSTKCSSTLNGVSTTFKVNALPNVSNLSVLDASACLNADATVTLNNVANLVSGDTISFDLDTTLNNTAIFTLTGNGTGTFPVSEGLFGGTSGVKTITIKSVTNANGCSVVIPSIVQGKLNVNPIESNIGLNASVSTPICIGNSATVTLQGGNLQQDQIYTLTYVLSGFNSKANGSTTIKWNGSNNPTTFIIPGNELANAGATDITLILVTNTTTGCSLNGSPIVANFVVEDKPTVASAEISIQNVCLSGNTGALVTITSSGLTAGNQYQFNYTLSGANVTSSTQTSSIVTIGQNGIGSFTIPSGLLTKQGSTTFNLIGISNTDINKCGAISINGVVSVFTVLGIPTVTTNQIKVDPICLGQNIIINVTGSTLPIGDYAVSYSLNSGASQTTTISIDATGNGSSLPIDTSSLVAGQSSILISGFSNSVSGCNTVALNILKPFTVNALTIVDAPNTTVKSDPTEICLGQKVTITVTAPDLSIGQYDVFYNLKLNGSTVLTSSFTNITMNASKEVIFDLQNELKSSGNYSLTITGVGTSGVLCPSFSNLVVSTSFTVDSIPTISGTDVVIKDVCLGQNAFVEFPNLPDGTYTIDYNVGGQNFLANKVVLSSLNKGFAIDNSLLVQGSNTITINSILNTVSKCQSSGVAVSKQFLVNPLPNSNGLIVKVNDTCLKVSASGTIEKAFSLPNGSYTITYDLLDKATNTTTSNLTTVATLTNGFGPITISDSNFVTSGDKTITITSISNANSCSSLVVTASDDFNVGDAINTDNATIVVDKVQNICVSNGTNAVLSGLTIPDGQYTLAFDIKGPKNTSGIIATVDLIGGKDSTIAIDAAYINLPGDYTITVSGISSSSTCTGTTKTISDNFKVNAVPNVTVADVTLGSICVGQNGVVSISNLPVGSYTIGYTLAQGNTTIKQSTANITIPNTSTFSIDTSLLAAGNYTFTINSITDGICNNSSVNTTVSFDINDLPNLASFTIDFTDICLPSTDPAIVPFSTNLDKGFYNFTFNFSDGTTTTNDLNSSVSVDNGTGFINISKSLLTTTGTKSIVITIVENSNKCKVSNLTIQDSFNVNPLLDVSNVSISVIEPICLGGNAEVLVNAKAANIPEGVYTISYDLTFGSSTVTRTGIVDLNPTNNFTNSFAVLATDLTAIGDYSIKISSALGNNNCSASSINAVVSFKVGNVPQLQNADLSIAKVCYGNDGIITINSSTLLDGNYTANYILTFPDSTQSSPQTGTFTMLGGKSTTHLTIDKSMLVVLGNTTVTINQLVQDGSISCTNSTLSVIGTINVVDLPSVAGITIDFLDSCIVSGSSTTTQVSYTTNLPNGNYTFNLSLNGGSIISYDTVVTSGSGSVSMDSSLLSTSGIKTLVFENFLNENRCGSAIVNLNDSFIVRDALDVSKVVLKIDSPVCKGSSIPVSVDASATALTTGQYTIGFNLVLNGVATPKTKVFDLDAALKGSFTLLDQTDITVTGEYSLTGITITLNNGQNQCNPSPYTTEPKFTVSSLPTLLAAEITVAPICSGNSAKVEINSSNLSDGVYTFTYDLTYPNSTKSTLQTVSNVGITGGKGSFDILANLVSFSGLTTLTVSGISLSTVCGNNSLVVQKDIRVDALIDPATLTLTMTNGCLGSDITGKIENLPSGTFKIFFDLSNPNFASNQSVDVATDGTFIISKDILLNAGLNTITIKSIVNTISLCTTSSLTISKDFNLIALPNISGGEITAALTNLCGKTDLSLVLDKATFLEDGDYIIKYSVSGSNVSVDNTIKIKVTGGKATFAIPYISILNSGVSTITIQDITSDLTKCSAPNTTVFSPINVTVDDPAPPVMDTDGNVFCNKNNPTIANLSANTIGVGKLTWYDAPEKGYAYSSNDLLQNGNKYYASLTSDGGCEGTVRLVVFADLTACGKVFIPDGFSPNGDGLNDEFYVKDIENKYPQFKIEIYNRYGSIVFKGDVANPRFNGKSNQTTAFGHSVLPVGVYFYILYLNDAENTPPIQGRLFLNR